MNFCIHVNELKRINVKFQKKNQVINRKLRKIYILYNICEDQAGNAYICKYLTVRIFSLKILNESTGIKIN